MIYLTHTRTNLAYTIILVSQFIHDEALASCRMCSTISQNHRYGKGSCLNRRKTIETYIDVDYVGSMKNVRSTSYYCTLLCGNMVAWRSNNQSVVAPSKAKPKFRVS